MKSGLSRVLPVRYEESLVSVLDGRSRLGREVRDRLQALSSDLGGHDSLSHAQYSLARRAVWMEMMLEAEELRIAEGQGIDIAPHVALVNSLLHVYRALGLKKQAREVRLADYLKKGEE
jgi:hypothetical protein